MAPRKSPKTTAAQGVEMILSENPQKNMIDAAQEVGVAPERLAEMFVEQGLEDAVLWETVPTEHEPILAEIKRQQEAFESVRPETLPTQAQEQVPVVEPPIALLSLWEEYNKAKSLKLSP